MLANIDFTSILNKPALSSSEIAARDRNIGHDWQFTAAQNSERITPAIP
jgi:hypothetical protein